MKILIAGDLVPTEKNIEKFSSDKFIDYLGDDFKKNWFDSDFRMFNLECPLGEKLLAIEKSGPNLLAPSETLKGIASLKPSLLFLANNHILDYSTEGLDSTLELLNKYHINYTGIINSNKMENETFYIEKDDVRVGIYNVCENEFSVATENKKGANGLNELKNYIEIEKAKQNCDYLIVIFHGGKEFYRYPSPNLKRICQNFVKFGADVVLTQHSHCIGCFEEYENSTIIYGQGNFIFDGGQDEFWNTALIISLDITTSGISIDYIPIEKKGELICISNKKEILSNFKLRSREIKEAGFIDAKYKNFANEYLNKYLHIMSKVRFSTRLLNRLFNRKFFIKTYNKVDCLRILNIIECEAHRELLIKGLKNKIEKNEE